ncbi:predicted protein [Chaetoceros tenuissimus]|uniref:F-box domain-containing protein n=1 Tax=Chaetoceros tenuissimus TaxID=426638 RepID=A0AAD3D107_9STRA|nr:predicted protein [Chaetoceros tenuissimus]
MTLSFQSTAWKMATPEYLEQLNKALPTSDYGGSTANDLRAKMVGPLKNEEEPPVLGDPSAPTINVIADASWCNRPMDWFPVKNTNVLMSYFNDLCKGLEIDIPDNEVHYVWRPKQCEAKIHMGENNIERAIYEIGVKMVENKMREDVMAFVFLNDDYNAETIYDLFGDPNDEESYYTAEIPMESTLDADFAEKKQIEEVEKLLSRASEFEQTLRGLHSFKREWEYIKSKKAKRMLLPALKSRFAENAKAMIFKERAVISSPSNSGEENNLLLSMPFEVQNKIMLYMPNMKDLFQFSLVSKACKNVTNQTIYSFRTKSNVSNDEEEKIVLFHNLDELFEGISLGEIASAFDELICCKYGTKMITPEYLEKLNEALPKEGYDSGERTVLNLKQKVMASLSKGEEPPPLGDPNAKTITVITKESSWRMSELICWTPVNSGPFATCINDLLKAMGINIPDNESHYLWIYKKSEARIHLGEENIDRAIYEIGVKMILTDMKADILERVFDDEDEGNAECNHELFGDPNDEDSYDRVTIPTEVDLARVNSMFQQEAGKERREVVQSRKKQRTLLPTLKQKFLQNATAMLAKEKLTFNETASDERNGFFLSMRLEVQNKILLYLGLPLAKDLLHFGLASKSCYKMFCNVLLVELGLNKEKKDGEEEIIRIHSFEDIFEGMSLHFIARSFDELIWFDGRGQCELYPA